jgi:hypothetical protein
MSAVDASVPVVCFVPCRFQTKFEGVVLNKQVQYQ